MFTRFLLLPLSWLLCCFPFVARSLAQSTTPSASDTTSIRVTVLNSKTHEPVGHALVVSADNRFAGFTDDSGHFEFKVGPAESTESVPGGFQTRISFPYVLEARKPGFLAAERVPLGNLGDSGSKNVTLFLTPESLIVGHVALPSSNGVDRILVELLRRDFENGMEHWNSVRNISTRSDGEFRFYELESGTYKILTHELLDRDPISFTPGSQLWGYPPVYFPSAADFESSAVIDLAKGATFVADFSPSRREYYNVKIKIANAPEGVSLETEVWPQGRPSPGYSLGYNAAQQTLQGMLPNGDYLIRVTSFGSQDGQSGTSGALNLSIKGAAVEHESLTLLPNTSIAVIIREEFQHGQPRPQSFVADAADDEPASPQRFSHLEVNLFPVQLVGAAPSSSLNQFRGSADDLPKIENVRPGTYRVLASSAVGYVASISSGGLDLTAHDLVVPPGGAALPIEVTVRDDGAEVTGTVEGRLQAAETNGPSGGRMQQTFIYFLPVHGTGAQFRTSAIFSPDRDAPFGLQQIPPGEYRVLAFNRQNPALEFATEESLKKYEDKMRSVTLTANQKSSVRVSLAASREQ